MATGQDQLTRIEYERQLREYENDHELLIRLGLEVFDVKDNCSKICPDPGPDRKQRAFNYTGLAGFVAAVIIGILEWFRQPH